jgi:crotonobetainyl-CoA:carnitine CoA-transferase CaiB-like acyl-CoA transferase
MRKRGGPLEGVRVVELTKVWAGPYVGKMLGFLGAEVIRVESRESLDVTRTFGVDDIDKAPGFMAVNPEKLSVTIDMKTPEGVALILDLLRKADIVVENLRPGAIQRLGLGYEAVKAANPGIIYVSMGMYGNEGPLAYQTGYAPCFAALGGMSGLVGYEGAPPSGMNVRYGDSTFGAASAYAAIAALIHRRKSGVGQFIDVSAVECVTSMVVDAVMAYTVAGETREQCGSRHPQMAPHGVYPCADNEWVAIAVSSDEKWRSLAYAMGQPRLTVDPGYATCANRKARENEIDQMIAAWTATQRADEVVRTLQEGGVAAGKSLNSIDLIAEPDFWARGLFQAVDVGDGETKPVMGPSWKMSRGAALAQGAPRLGQHNAYVFGEVLGLSLEDQQALEAAGAIR